MRDAFLGKGMLKEALEVSLRRKRDTPEVTQALQRGYDQREYQAAAREAAALIEARWRKGIFPAGLPVFYTMAGQTDKLLEFWEWTVERRDPNAAEGVRQGARMFPQLESNPRYQAILRRMGLP